MGLDFALRVSCETSSPLSRGNTWRFGSGAETGPKPHQGFSRIEVSEESVPWFVERRRVWEHSDRQEHYGTF